METFGASVQYNDWTGSAAADRSDAKTLDDLLRERGLIVDDEFLVGAKLWVGENHGNKLSNVFVSAFVYDGTGYDDVSRAIKVAGDHLQLRRIEVEISLEDFVTLFKRFAVSLSPEGLDLEGRQFTAVE